MAAQDRRRDRRRDRRILIVAFDALRPDMVSAETMPNLVRFAEAGVRFADSRSTFPSETRVNQTALVTGCYPARHGIVGNTFLDDAAAPGKLFDTGDETELAAGDRRLDGKLVDVPVMGEILAARGRSLAVISAGTPGGARILHHKAEQLGGFRFALHRPDASRPSRAIGELLDRLGPVPRHEIPSLDWLGYATAAYLDYVEPALAPDVTILWLCEPDNSYHYLGIGSPANLAAIRRADAEFGRILAWRESSAIGRRLQVITLSDHGQLTVIGPAVGIAAGLESAGFRVAESLADGADAALALASAGGIYVRRSEPDLIAAIVDWLQRQPWCGPVFTADGGDALERRLVGLEHRRAPDIGLALRSEDSVNEHGRPGATVHDSHYPIGGGLHGGLHPLELRTWLAADGDGFRNRLRSPLTAGIIDVLPTVLDLLGVAPPDRIDGRVLGEALADHGDAPPPEVSHQRFTAEGAAGYRAHLAVTRVGTTPYLDRAWTD